MDYLSKKNEIKTLKSELKCAYDGIKPDVLRNKVAELEAEQNAEGFWNDVQNAQKVSILTANARRRCVRRRVA